MITLTIVKQVKKGSQVTWKKELKMFNSVDKARKEITPIVREMKVAKKQKRDPQIAIKAVSYDLKSEKTMLLETDAIISVENESDDGDGR